MKKLGKETNLAVVAIWDCGSPLYDSYELASLGHLLERHTMASPFLRRSSRFSIPTSVIESNEGCTMDREDDHHHEGGFITKLGGFRNLLKTKRTTTRRKIEQAKRLSGIYGLFSALLVYVRSRSMKKSEA